MARSSIPILIAYEFLSFLFLFFFTIISNYVLSKKLLKFRGYRNERRWLCDSDCTIVVKLDETNWTERSYDAFIANRRLMKN